MPRLTHLLAKKIQLFFMEWLLICILYYTLHRIDLMLCSVEITFSTKYVGFGLSIKLVFGIGTCYLIKGVPFIQHKFTDKVQINYFLDTHLTENTILVMNKFHCHCKLILKDNYLLIECFFNGKPNVLLLGLCTIAKKTLRALMCLICLHRVAWLLTVHDLWREIVLLSFIL